MHLLPLDATELHFMRADFVLRTQRQLIKDFNTVSIDFPADFSEIAYSYTSILDVLSQRISVLLRDNTAAFFQLCYQIDLPETFIAPSLSEKHPEKSIAILFLQREAYKVFLKERFQK